MIAIHPAPLWDLAPGHRLTGGNFAGLPHPRPNVLLDAINDPWPA